MIAQRLVRIMIYNAVCSKCKSLGPDGFSPEHAHLFALDAGWSKSAGRYTCQDSSHVGDKPVDKPIRKAIPKTETKPNTP